MRYLYLILFVLLANISLCFAVKTIAPIKQKAILKTDTSTINLRHFDKTALAHYSKQPEFQYREDVYEPSLWTRFWRWFWRAIASLFENKGSLTGIFFTFLKYAFIVAGVGAIVYMLLKMLGVDVLNIFRRKAAPATLPYTESLENIHQIDFDSEIERATAQHNYRLAVRLLYLRCLKQLSDAALISWQPEKTNNAYVNELNNNVQRSTFKQLTRQFEYIWYGDFPIDNAVFAYINQLFQQFKNDIA